MEAALNDGLERGRALLREDMKENSEKALMRYLELKVGLVDGDLETEEIAELAFYELCSSRFKLL
jgi:hypothetical protein